MAEPPHGYGPYLFQTSAATDPSASLPLNNPSYRGLAPAGAIPPTSYTVSQIAYDFNSNRIPGLGLSAPPTASTALPLPAPPVWNNQAETSQVNSQFPTKYQPPASFANPQPLSHHGKNLEEGELSEGEFEDIYEPRHPTNAADAAPHGLTRNANSRNGSAGDADGSSIYDPRDSREGSREENRPTAVNKAKRQAEQSPPDDEWEPSYPDRERSGSYSPYLSPREVHRRISVAKVGPNNDKSNDRPQAARPAHQSGVGISSAMSTTVSEGNGTTAAPRANNSTATSTSKSQDEPGVNGAVSARSPTEAKKKAQEAILGLLPLKVRYQDYIEEGFNESVVQALFKDLGLAIPATKVTSQPASTGHKAQADTIQGAKPPTEPASQLQDKAIPPPSTDGQRSDKEQSHEGGGPTLGGKSAAEERKDKIARKLAAMAQKTTVAQSSGPATSSIKPATVPAPVPAPAGEPASIVMTVQSSVPSSARAPAQATASSTTKPDATPTSQPAHKTKAENTAILQQKLAKLKMQQARLAAERAKAASSGNTTTSSPAPAESKPHAINRNSNLTPKPTTVGPSGQPPNQLHSPAEPHHDRDPSMPSQLRQSKTFPPPTQSLSRSLKRPVASDFDSCTPPVPTLKRSRTDERLVIDVSDDEDVEMDIGSPSDEVGPSADSTMAPRASVGTFQPLSDSHRLQQPGSPASSSAATPPVKGARIDILHRRIEETKRMIAEAEAKKAAKKGTPQQSPGPPSPAAQQTLSIPKLRKLNDVGSRRDRIASFELPRVNATLKEKQDLLKQIVSQAAQLELEVQASLEEERRLRAEMEQLEVPIENSPSPEGQSPRPAPATARSPIAEEQALLDVQQDSSRGFSSIINPTLTSDSSSSDGDEEMDVDSNDDEALQTPIVDGSAHGSDDQMAATAGSVATNRTTSPSIQHSPTEADSQTPPSQTPAGKALEQTQKETSTDISVEPVEPVVPAQPTTVPDAPTGSAVSNEPDVSSSDSDISMQQSAPESPQSDEESYEPTPAHVPHSHNQEDEQAEAEAFDDVPEEPSPIHTIPENQKALEVEGASHEGEQESRPAVGDLLSYKSPLSYFRAYKFHPNYSKDVAGGLKSMTYSAQIDPMRAVCPLVLAGENCPNGSKCEYQHFDSMLLTDAQIITQLGSASAKIFTGEMRVKFIQGLKKVLNDLKANRIKDFDRVAEAIIKHRQDFLGDSSKVLALDSSMA